MRAIPLPPPSQEHSAPPFGEYPMLCSVGGKLVKHHCQRLSGLRVHSYKRACDVKIASRVRFKLAPCDLSERNIAPMPTAQQLMRSRQRSYAAIEAGHEVN